ncbi:MAG TPA: hypothetical protein VF043_34075, partial [Ktedonobacteraceae bacterium]
MSPVACFLLLAGAGKGPGARMGPAPGWDADGVLATGTGVEEEGVHGVYSFCGWCMTFRHRHVRRRRLIELAEVEEGKAEAGERKPEAREEEKRAIREQSG